MLSDVAAEQIREHRKRAKLTHTDLSDRCSALGWPALTASAISNIETGRRSEDGRRRREITVDELTVLAQALEIPPLLLVTPLGEHDTVEVLPGKTVPTLHAFKWWSGESILDGVSGPAQVITTFKAYEQAVLSYMGAQSSGDEQQARRSWQEIQNLQRTMQSFGWRIPAFPGEGTEDEGSSDGGPDQVHTGG